MTTPPPSPAPLFSATQLSSSLKLLGHSPNDSKEAAKLSAFVQQLQQDLQRWKSQSVTVGKLKAQLQSLSHALSGLEQTLQGIDPVTRLHLRLAGSHGICELQVLQMQATAHRNALAGALPKFDDLPGQTKVGLSAQNCHQLFVDMLATYFDIAAVSSKKTRKNFKNFVDDIGWLIAHHLPASDTNEYAQLFRIPIVQQWPSK